MYTHPPTVGPSIHSLSGMTCARVHPKSSQQPAKSKRRFRTGQYPQALCLVRSSPASDSTSQRTQWTGILLSALSASLSLSVFRAVPLCPITGQRTQESNQGCRLGSVSFTGPLPGTFSHAHPHSHDKQQICLLHYGNYVLLVPSPYLRTHTYSTTSDQWGLPGTTLDGTIPFRLRSYTEIRLQPTTTTTCSVCYKL